MTGVVLADCRPRAAYDAGHVPGAVHLDPEQELSAPAGDPAVGGRHPLPADEALAKAFGAAGIDDTAFVLAYDEGTGWAARCWWLLRHLGHDECGTFDLRSYGGTLTTAPAERRTTRFEARARGDDTIGTDEIRARLGDGKLVLYDARAPERWRGETEPLDPVAGRIPGSRNAYFEEPLPVGATAPDELVAYCGSGVTACVVIQQLVAAGREDARLYAGSFSEWCRSPSNPIERGKP